MAVSRAPYRHDHRLLQFPKRSVPRRLTVSTEHVAQFSSIQDAVDAANPGDTIVLAAGLYLESLVIDKPVHLVGPCDPRFADVEGAADDAAFAHIIGATAETITWSANGGSISDLAISRADIDVGTPRTALVRMLGGTLQVRRCVLSDGARCGIGCRGGTVEISRTHIRNVTTGVCILDGTAHLERSIIEGHEIVAVNVDTGAHVTLRDNSFEGRSVLRGSVHTFTGNDLDTLFVDEAFSTSGNRVGSLVRLCDFRPSGGLAVGV